MRYYTKTVNRSWTMEYRAQIGDFIANLSDDDAIKEQHSHQPHSAADYIEIEFKPVLQYHISIPYKQADIHHQRRTEAVSNELYVNYRVRPSDSDDTIPADAGGDASRGCGYAILIISRGNKPDWYQRSRCKVDYLSVYVQAPQ